MNDDEETDQVFDEQIEKMKKLSSVNEQNRRIRDLAKKTSTWLSSVVNEINGSFEMNLDVTQVH